MSTILEQTKKKIEEKVPAEVKKMYGALVTNGMKLMWSDQTHKTMAAYVKQGIQSPEDIPSVVAAGMRGVIRLLLQASKTPPDPNHMFYSAAYPAAITLMCDALEYVEAVKKIEITKDIIAQTTQETVAQINTFFGIKKETIDAAMKHAQEKEKSKGGVNAPQAMGQDAAMPQDEV